MPKDTQVIIVGAGPGGLVLALSLHQIGIHCRVYESVAEMRSVGAGINLLPHAVREYDELGLLQALEEVGVKTRDVCFFSRHGQFIYRELAGQAAGYDWPQFAIHRADLQTLLVRAVRARLGHDSIVTGHRCVSVSQDSAGVSAHFVGLAGEELPSARATVVVGCDGIDSAIRRQFYPAEGDPIYSGVTVWRGVTPFKPILSGAATSYAGWLSVGKLIVYPIRNAIDNEGNQLMNWVASLERPKPDIYDWNRHARLADFFAPYADWHFDWLDVPAMMQKTEPILVFPMVDRDPVRTWTFGNVTLLGDAAHPMYQRGSNGTGQATLDARFLAGCFKRKGVTEAALCEYDEVRVEATTKVVLMNRSNPPDAILREVHVRSKGEPFDKIDDIISPKELQDISNRYKVVAEFDIEQLRKRPSFV